MIDIKILRKEPELLKANCEKRGCKIDIDQLVEYDRRYLNATKQVEEMRARRNALSKECRDNPAAREEVKQLKEALAVIEEEQRQMKEKVEEGLSWMPNFLDPSVPDGKGDEDNQPLRFVGTKPEFGFKPLAHDEIGDKLDIIDTTRGSKVAQSGFYFWKGKGAQLAQALFFWTQQQLAQRGFTVFMSPCLAKSTTLFGTGYLPFFSDQVYRLENEDLALIGTSEQTLVAYHAEEVLEAESLPLKYTAYTPCFRTEAGSYGKEVRGIFRVHQFHKVEQIIFCAPEESPALHDHCLDNEEYLLQQLGLPYRVVNVCLGDMGAPGFKKYDIEAWFAGYGGYREVTSNTNLTDFQSRRLGIRFKTKDGQRDFVHTISATAVTDRVVCAILEHYQQEDGSVIIPEALRPYCGFDVIKPPGA